MKTKPSDDRLDDGIRPYVETLRAAEVETFESCEGGDGHAYPEPTVRFHGGRSEGFRALAAALQAGLPVGCLRRVWPVNDGEPTGPWWELTFSRKAAAGPGGGPRGLCGATWRGPATDGPRSLGPCVLTAGHEGACTDGKANWTHKPEEKRGDDV